MDETRWKAGLEDVIAARSAVCAIDGAAGRLFYRGYEIAELAGAVSLEGGGALLWRGGRPASAQAAGFRARRSGPPGRLRPLGGPLRPPPRRRRPPLTPA